MMATLPFRDNGMESDTEQQSLLVMGAVAESDFVPLFASAICSILSLVFQLVFQLFFQLVNPECPSARYYHQQSS
jgi:hypothetical protein